MLKCGYYYSDASKFLFQTEIIKKYEILKKVAKVAYMKYSRGETDLVDDSTGDVVDSTQEACITILTGAMVTSVHAVLGT